MSGTEFITTQSDTDPETGKISWDVDYKPDFSGILDNINTVILDLKKAIKKHSVKDPAILTSLKALRSTKSALLNTLQSKYPEYIKNYFGN
jgi:hypothetical protein